MTRVCVAGVTGWTGSAVAAAVEAASDLELVAGVSRSDPASYSTVAEALETTLDVDIFSPPRQDWLDGSDAYLRSK